MWHTEWPADGFELRLRHLAQWLAHGRRTIRRCAVGCCASKNLRVECKRPFSGFCGSYSIVAYGSIPKISVVIDDPVACQVINRHSRSDEGIGVGVVPGGNRGRAADCSPRSPERCQLRNRIRHTGDERVVIVDVRRRTIPYLTCYEHETVLTARI